MTQPASVTFDGTELILWVPTIASISAPTLAELTGGSVVDLSFYFTDTGWNPQLSEAGIKDNRAASDTDFSGPGRKSYSFPLLYVYNPLVPAQDKARTTLLENASGYFVERTAVPNSTALAAGQLVRCYAVKLGRQMEAGRTANQPWVIQQSAYLRPPGTTSALVAVV